MSHDDYPLRAERQRQTRQLADELAASAARDHAAAEAARDVGPRTDRKAKRLAC
jgi:hypothetical protein